MKTKHLALTVTLALGLSAMLATAQETDGQPRRGNRPPPTEGGPDVGQPGQGQRPPAPPFFAALDLNGDGVVDADELAKASESLKKLDKNGDGKLSLDELRPPRPGGQGGPGRGGQAGGGPNLPPRGQ